MKKIIITTVLAAFIFVSVSPFVQAADDEAQRKVLLAQIDSLLKLVLALQERVAAQTGSQTTDSVFTDIISSGSENDSVTLLQQVLASDPSIYPEAMVTGYFGPLTSAALQKFQLSWGLDATGTFTNQTRYVLSKVLREVPLDDADTDYLQKTEVRNVIKQAINDYNSESLVVDGKVVFSSNPTFEPGQKNANIATLQRILATDAALYPEQQVSTEYTTATGEAVGRLQARYGLTVTARVDTPTLDLLKHILVINNSATIQPGLLKKDALAPDEVIDTKARGIDSIVVTKDYREAGTMAKVNYTGGYTESFLLFDSNSGDRNTKDLDVIKRRLATVLDRPLETFGSKVTLTVVDRPELPYKAVIVIDKNREISAYLAFRQKGKIDIHAPVDLDMNYSVQFKNTQMTLKEASDIIISEAISGMPVDEELAAYVRKEAVFYYDTTASEISRIPFEYEVDPSVRNSSGGGGNDTSN